MFVEGYRSFLQHIGPSQEGLDVFHCLIGILGMILSGGVETAQRSNETHWDQRFISVYPLWSLHRSPLPFPVAAEFLTYFPIPVNIIAAGIRMNLQSRKRGWDCILFGVPRTDSGIAAMAVITYASLWISPFVVMRIVEWHFPSDMETKAICVTVLRMNESSEFAAT